MWERLDLQEKEEYWNRYAHIDVDIINEPNKSAELELLGADYVRLTVNIESIKDLGANYILSNKKMDYGSLEQLYECEGFYIYQILI